jgi:hypothetical protein
VEGPETHEEEERLEIRNRENQEEPVQTKAKTVAESPPKPQKCTHGFGYLSKRSSKEKIPEECMMCENIVQCMLKNVTS